MKKSLLSLALCCALVLGCTAVRAAENMQVGAGSNPVDQFTGELWQKSAETEKLAFLFGVETAIAVENFVNAKVTEKSAKAGRKPVYTLSPFEKSWMEAFREVPRAEIAKQVDAWYAAHPDQLERPVMAVIWYEIIVPRLPVKK